MMKPSLLINHARYASATILLLMTPLAAFAQVTSTWNGTTGNWSDFTRWSTNPLFPNNGNGGNDYNAVVNGGTVTLDQDIVIEGLTLNGGTISGDFDLNLNGSSTWNGTSTMGGTGTTTIANGGTLSITHPNTFPASFVTATLSRQLVNDGAIAWTASGTSSWSLNNGQIANNGTFTVSGSNAVMSSGGGTNTFSNVGTFIKQGASNISIGSGIVFTNSGTVDIQQGSMSLAGGGTHTGDFSIAAATSLSLSGGHTFAATSDFGGTGAINVSNAITFSGPFTFGGTLSNSGTLDFQDTATVSQFNLDGGTLTGIGNLILTGNSTWNGTSTMGGTGTTTIANGGTLSITHPNTFPASFVTATLSRQLVNDGAIAWTASGTSSWSLNNGQIANNGTFTVSGSNAVMSSGGGTNTFSNVGTFIKQGASNISIGSGIVFTNSGTVDIQQGSMSLAGGGTHTGDFNVAAGTTLSLSGVHDFSTSSELTGAGTLSIVGGTTSFNGQQTSSGMFALSGGTVNFNNDSQAGGLDLSGGTVGGTGTVTFNGTSTWTFGTMSGSGTTDIVSGTITGSSTKTLNNRTLRSAGNINWSQGNITTSGTRGTIHVLNGSTFTVSGSGSKTLNANLLIDLGGTLLHTSTGTTTHTGGTFINNGLVQVDAGILQFNAGGTGSGTFVVAPGATLQFNGPGHNYNGGVTLSGGTLQLATFSLTNGTVQGTGTIDATTFTNASEVAPGIATGDEIGVLLVEGDYEQTSDGNLSIDIEGMSDFDTLAITGDAALGGSLSVLIPNDGSVQAGDTFTVITAGDTMDTKFDDIFTIGNDDLFAKPVYNENEISLFMAYEGDMDQLGDGVTEDDVIKFAMALTDPDRYDNEHDADSREAGDIDDDGDCDVDDIDNFADLLGMSLAALTHRIQAYSTQVPEPTSAVLAGMLLMIGALRRRAGFPLSTASLRPSRG